MKILRITVGEYVEGLRSGKLVMAPVAEIYPYGHLKAKSDLSAHEWQQLTEETNYLCVECTFELSFVGGTRSSARVRRAKAHLETLNALATKPNGLGLLDVMPLIDATQSALNVARVSLAKHNAQPRKFISYDLETGEPFNQPDYHNVDYKEILTSLGVVLGDSPERKEDD